MIWTWELKVVYPHKLCSSDDTSLCEYVLPLICAVHIGQHLLVPASMLHGDCSIRVF